MQEVEINDENFSIFFRDTRTNKPEKGDIIAEYSAIAEFIEGNEKKQIIDLLTSTENKMQATSQVMRKLLFASEIDSYKVPRQMAEDLLSGMTEEEVCKKPYKYKFEMFFYAKPQHVPNDDPHWSIISVLNLNEYIEKEEENKCKV